MNISEQHTGKNSNNIKLIVDPDTALLTIARNGIVCMQLVADITYRCVLYECTIRRYWAGLIALGGGELHGFPFHDKYDALHCLGITALLIALAVCSYAVV